jgi:NADH-quinone oxidoreductase subunit N
MNGTFFLEISVTVLGLGILLTDLWTPAEHKRSLGYVCAAALLGLLITSFFVVPTEAVTFQGMFVSDGLALFFKRFFLAAAVLVLLIAVEFADRLPSAITEFFALLLFALVGMFFAASANDLIMVFVSLELITISFYILTSFQRNRLTSLESGVKYLILGALSTGFLVFGIALVFGTAGTTNFQELRQVISTEVALTIDPLFLLGVLLILAGLAFKIAAFPFQLWAPDVYQGSPAPATAFLAVGSKAAGFVLLIRVVYQLIPQVAAHWRATLIVVAAITILYGNLCAIPQRNLKRLLGYSSISNAGYLLLGIVALNSAGLAGVLYYLAGYLFSVIAAFAVISMISARSGTDDISALAGLSRRSPFLAGVLSLSMISLAGIPPLAGFFGKFLLLKSIIQNYEISHGYLCLAGVLVVGVVISLYYYLGVVRAIYWSSDASDLSPISISLPSRALLAVCAAGMLYLGVYPDCAMRATETALKTSDIQFAVVPAPVTRAASH